VFPDQLSWRNYYASVLQDLWGQIPDHKDQQRNQAFDFLGALL
jgi:hypothetical protein